MKKIIITLSSLLLLNSCASLNDSMLLGAGLGATVASVATSVNYNEKGFTPTSEEIYSSATIGLISGLVISYLIHDNTEKYRKDLYYQNPEIHFGDLPPSPFIMTPFDKKGGR